MTPLTLRVVSLALMNLKAELPDMRYIVELRCNVMQQLRPSKPILRLYLRTEMPKYDDSRHLRSDQYRSDQQFEMLQPVGIAANSISR